MGGICLFELVNLRQASYRSMVCTGSWWGWGSGGGERLRGRQGSESVVKVVYAVVAAVDAGVVLSA